MKDRIRKLRRHLDMTQEEFAERIGVKRNTVAQYETGRNIPIDTVLFLICKEFNVNERWLRTGEGEMINPAPTDELDMLQKKYNLSNGMYVLIEKLVNARPEVQDMLVDMLSDIAAGIQSDPEAVFSRPSDIKKDGSKTLDPKTATDEEKKAAYDEYLKTKKKAMGE